MDLAFIYPSLPTCLVVYVQTGAQPALHFEWARGNFHESSFDEVIVLIQPWHNFFADGLM